MTETIKSPRLGEEYIVVKHPSGLDILLCPMKGFRSVYALFGTEYGSIDTTFKTSEGPFVTVPAGIAHFLEHKLFEGEDGDAFVKYAKTGASANAYTSFDKTCYLFSTTENFVESLDILLDFVTSPYFTKETVAKEQGIIGQEISMYDDSPDWRVFFNMLNALYHSNPVKIDIAGTADTIAQIDDQILYTCYNTFYNLNNMALAIAGNFTVEEVLAAADRHLKKASPLTIERGVFEEPPTVVRPYIEQHLPVSLPLFQMGLKLQSLGKTENLKAQILDEVLIDIISGDASGLFRRLYDGGLVNSGFAGEVLSGRDYHTVIFSGESKDPEKVCGEIKAEIERFQKDGIDVDAFSRIKKSTYGRYIRMYSRNESVAGLMMLCHFVGVTIYELLDIIANLTLNELTDRLSVWDVNNSALSVVK